MDTLTNTMLANQSMETKVQTPKYGQQSMNIKVRFYAIFGYCYQWLLIFPFDYRLAQHQTELTKVYGPECRQHQRSESR